MRPTRSFRLLTLRNLLILLVAGLVLGGLAIAAAAVLLPKRTGVPGFTDRTAPIPTKATTDDALRRRFAPGQASYDRAAYETLARYFLEGWASYRTQDGARAHYPGAPSAAGRSLDGLEGFARIFPLAGAWLAGGRPRTIDLGDGRTLDLVDALVRGLTTGTDPSGPAYWGRVESYSPQLVESADIALGLWLTRELVWPRLDAGQRARVVEWLGSAAQAEPYEGNWQLFPMLSHRVLRALGADTARWDARMQTNWEVFKTFHRGQGWFFDPPNGFDYYNAWSIHYAMFWLQRIDPGFDRAFVRETLAPFAATYRHLFGPQGHPMFGRSVCYRMAAPVPLLTAQSLAPQSVSRGEAMRALDLTWSVFLARGAVADGAPTQGFCGTDLATLANYSGPASCLWALRSLIAAFVLDSEIGLFDVPREPLPVERGDFDLPVETTGWRITGRRDTGTVSILVAANDGDPAMRPYGTRQRLLERLLQAPRRPDNHAALYGRRAYSSDRPLTDCPRIDAR